MNGVNKVILIGNVGNDPEIRYASNGNAIANVSLATSDSWKDKNTNERQTRTEWHRVVFFGRLAEVVNDYVRKGSKLYVEGRLQTRKWTDQNNMERYTTEVVVDIAGSMQMLDSRQERQNSNYTPAPPPAATASQAPAAQPQPATRSASTTVSPAATNFDDDLPF